MLAAADARGRARPEATGTDVTRHHAPVPAWLLVAQIAVSASSSVIRAAVLWVVLSVVQPPPDRTETPIVATYSNLTGQQRDLTTSAFPCR